MQVCVCRGGLGGFRGSVNMQESARSVQYFPRRVSMLCIYIIDLVIEKQKCMYQ